MERRNIILIGVLAALVLSSAFLLYRSFNAQPLTITPVSVSDEDVQRQSEAEALKQKMHRAIKIVDPGGAFDLLTQSKQFIDLSADAIRRIEIGSYGRPNPFLPVQ